MGGPEKLSFRRHPFARLWMSLIGLSVTVVLVIYFATELTIERTQQRALVPNSDLAILNNPSLINSGFPQRLTNNASRINNSTQCNDRVLMVLVDGLRYDFLTSNQALNQLLNDPWFVNNSLIYKSLSSMPTISVPNWQTLISSSTPELTGRMGNYDISMFQFDTIFDEASNYGLRVGISGDPWWQPLLGTRHLDVDGTHAADNVVEDPNTVVSNGYGSLDKSDDAWAEVARLSLLNSTTDFFLSYLEDVDQQGHAHGASSLRYNEAVTNKTRLIRSLLDAIYTSEVGTSPCYSNGMSPTTVIITADHGHINIGGHGGSAAPLRPIPIIVFRNNSYLKQQAETGTPSIPQQITRLVGNVDNAPTISALLGVPVPRESEGVFLYEVIDHMSAITNENERRIKHYQDLLRQKQQFVARYVSAIGQSSYSTDPSFNQALSDSRDMSVLRTNIQNLINIHDSARRDALNYRWTRNYCVSFAITLVCVVITFLSVQYTTYAIPPFKKCCRKSPMNASDSTIYSLLASQRKRAVVSTLIVLGLYFAIVFGIFGIVFRSYRYDSSFLFEFTMFNTLFDAFIVLITILIPAVMIALLFIVFLFLGWRKRSHRYRRLKEIKKSRSLTAFFYLFSTYSLFLSICIGFVFLAANGFYCMYLPNTLEVGFVSEQIWRQRFQSMLFSVSLYPLVFSFSILQAIIANSTLSRDLRCAESSCFIMIDKGLSETPANTESEAEAEQRSRGTSLLAVGIQMEQASVPSQSHLDAST